jgi:hypothetical protein
MKRKEEEEARKTTAVKKEREGEKETPSFSVVSCSALSPRRRLKELIVSNFGRPN